MSDMNLKHNFPLLLAIIAVCVSLPLFLFVTLTQRQDNRGRAFVPPSTYYNRIAKIKVTEFGTLIKGTGVGKIVDSTKIAFSTAQNVLGVTDVKAPEALKVNSLEINTQVFDQMKETDADNIFTQNFGKLKLYKVVVPDLSIYKDAEILFRSCASMNIEKCHAFSSFTERMYVFNSSYKPLIDKWGNWVTMDTRLELKKDYAENPNFVLPSDRTLLIYFGSDDTSVKKLPADFLVGFYTNPDREAYFLKTDDARTHPVEPKGFLTTCWAGKPCIKPPILALDPFVGKKVLAEGIMTQYYRETCTYGTPPACTSDKENWWPFYDGRQFEVEKIQPAELLNQSYQSAGKLTSPVKSYNGENVYLLDTVRIQPTIACIKAPCIQPNQPAYVRSSYQDLKPFVNQSFTAQGQLLLVNGQDLFINLNNTYLTPGPGRKIEFKNLMQGNPTSGYSNKSTGVIRDENEFWRMMNVLFPNQDVRIPKIDFKKYMVFFATYGQVGSGGYKVQFNEVNEYTDQIKTSVVFYNTSCLADSAIHYPYHLIYLPNNPKTVSFQELYATAACPPPSTVTPTTIPVNKAVLFFAPEKEMVNQNQLFATGLTINTQDLKVTAVDVTLAFDPGKIKVNTVTPQFSFPNVLVKPQIDNANGRIRIVVGSDVNKPVNGLATPVLLISATALKETNNTTINVIQGQVSALGSKENVLGKAGEFNLIIKNSLPGDIDKDSDVDIFDYNLLLQNFGNTNCGNMADLNGDCKVDIFDYNILLENFGKNNKTTSTPTPTSQPTSCGITNCHGMNIVCGTQIPRACTEIYEIGDRCRQFASCQSINNQCQPVFNIKYQQCKSCVETCLQQTGAASMDTIFACESRCAN